MNIKSKLKRSGFSLMELTLAVLIVAILIVITVPIINRQLEKSEEYSYYAAYRTVEKMSGQIVALGDPEEESFALKHKDSFINNMIAIFNDSKLKISRSFTSYKEKFANSEMFFFTRLFPKTIAEEIVAISWTSSTLDDLWLGYYVCNNYPGGGNSNIQKGDTQQEVETVVTNADGTTSTKKEIKTVQTYYTVSDFNCCVGYTKSASSTSPVVCKALKANGAPQEYVLQSGETCCLSFSSSCKEPCYKESGKTYENIVVNSGSVNDIIKNNLYSDPDTCNPNKSGSGASKIAELLKNATLSVSDGNYKINMNAKSICENTFINSCSGQTSLSKFYESDGSAGGTTYKNDEDQDDDSVEGDPTPYSEMLGACTVYKSVDMSSGTYTSSSYSPVRPTYSSNWCTDHGYVNMTNAAAPNSIDCVPISNYRISANNEKVACFCTNGETAYATGNSAKPCVCTSRDFNEVTKEPCGEHEVYSGGDKCECVPGWRRETESSQYCEERGTCPKGTTLSGNVCVVNPPIVSAKRFCELIAENWNVSSKSCNKFTDDVYTSVYNAALGSDTNKTYLSIQSQQGKFNSGSITPNIILSNGMRLWILGNKAASIPGLSYYSDPATMPINKKQNMCEKVAVETHTAEACMTAAKTVSYGGKSYNKGYFCANDKNCFKLSDASYPTTTRTTELLDARGCCAASDYTDFHEKAKTSSLGEDVYMQDPTVYSIGGFTIFVDINGAKGDGTLWDDVYPFYISSNGTVYPAYPLDAEKEKYKADGVTEASNALYIGGNSDKQLPTDVYYYEASSSGKAREKKIAFAGVSYARAVCSARKISRYTPYCLNLGKRFKGKGIFPKAGGGYEEVDLPENYIMLSRNSVKSKDSHNPCDYFVCYVSVKNKTRFF